MIQITVRCDEGDEYIARIDAKRHAFLVQVLEKLLNSSFDSPPNSTKVYIKLVNKFYIVYYRIDTTWWKPLHSLILKGRVGVGGGVVPYSLQDLFGVDIELVEINLSTAPNVRDLGGVPPWRAEQVQNIIGMPNVANLTLDRG